MFVSPSKSNRRSARVGRGTTSSSQRRWKRSSGRDAAGSSSLGRGDKARKWLMVKRPPAPGVGFSVPTWVPVSQLTQEEKASLLSNNNNNNIPAEDVPMSSEASTSDLDYVAPSRTASSVSLTGEAAVAQMNDSATGPAGSTTSVANDKAPPIPSFGLDNSMSVNGPSMNTVPDTQTTTMSVALQTQESDVLKKDGKSNETSTVKLMKEVSAMDIPLETGVAETAVAHADGTAWRTDLTTNVPTETVVPPKPLETKASMEMVATTFATATEKLESSLAAEAPPGEAPVVAVATETPPIGLTGQDASAVDSTSSKLENIDGGVETANTQPIGEHTDLAEAGVAESDGKGESQVPEQEAAQPMSTALESTAMAALIAMGSPNPKKTREPKTAILHESRVAGDSTREISVMPVSETMGMEAQTTDPNASVTERGDDSKSTQPVTTDERVNNDPSLAPHPVPTVSDTQLDSTNTNVNTTESDANSGTILRDPMDDTETDRASKRAKLDH